MRTPAASIDPNPAPGDTAGAVRRRPRFRVRTLLVLPVVVGLLLVMFNGCFESVRFGTATTQLDFLVVDSVTARPIPKAKISLIGWPSSYEANTDRSGRARFVFQATTATTVWPLDRGRMVGYRQWD